VSISISNDKTYNSIIDDREGEKIMTQTDPNANIDQKTGYGVEELQVMGEQLLSKVKELLHEGNVRRVIIKQDGHTLVEIPLTFGLAGVILAPTFAAIGVIGALIAQCSIEVVRTERPSDIVKDVVEPYTPPTDSTF
jgi:Domain of unknown function (DUF4342)